MSGDRLFVWRKLRRGARFRCLQDVSSSPVFCILLCFLVQRNAGQKSSDLRWSCSVLADQLRAFATTKILTQWWSVAIRQKRSPRLSFIFIFTHNINLRSIDILIVIYRSTGKTVRCGTSHRIFTDFRYCIFCYGLKIVLFIYTFGTVSTRYLVELIVMAMRNETRDL